MTRPLGPPLERDPAAPPTYRVEVEVCTRSGIRWHVWEGAELMLLDHAIAVAELVWWLRPQGKSWLSCVAVIDERTGEAVCSLGHAHTGREGL